MGRTWRKYFRRDQLFARPEARERIQTVRQCFTKDDDVRVDVKVLHGPKLSSPIKAHLNLVVDQQNVSFIKNLFERGKVFARWNYITARCLNRLGVKSRELCFTRFRIPE